MPRSSDGKVELSVGGVVMLAVATLIATGVVFLLGIYVGKGITEERLAADQRVVRLPAPAESGGKPEDEQLTFWDRLSEEEIPERTVAAQATVAPTPTEEAVRVEPPAAATPTVPPAATPTAVPAAKPTAAPAPKPTAAPTRPPRPTPTSAAAASLRGSFLVQVQALGDRAAADRIARSLVAKGYEAQVSPAKRDGKTLYRVRVGTFATEEEARAAIERLKREGFPGAFLAAGGD